MNRTFQILARFAIVLIPAIAVHIVARATWLFIGMGPNYNSEATSVKEYYATFADNGIPRVGTYYNTVLTEVPRTFWNYNTDVFGFVSTHIFGIAVVAFIVCIAWFVVDTFIDQLRYKQAIAWIMAGTPQASTGQVIRSRRDAFIYLNRFR